MVQSINKNVNTSNKTINLVDDMIREKIALRKWQNENNNIVTVNNNVKDVSEIEEVDLSLPSESSSAPSENVIVYINKFIEWAESRIGTKSINRGYQGDWCLQFVNDCIKSNTAFSDVKGYNLTFASCSAQVDYIKKNNPDAWHDMPADFNGITSSDYSPKPGDIFFIENHDDDRTVERDGYLLVARHVGIVSEVKKDESGNVVSITTIEGNLDGKFDQGYAETSVVGERSYTVDSKGRYVEDKYNLSIISGFFDTSSSIIEDK